MRRAAIGNIRQLSLPRHRSPSRENRSLGRDRQRVVWLPNLRAARNQTPSSKMPREWHFVRPASMAAFHWNPPGSDNRQQGSCPLRMASMERGLAPCAPQPFRQCAVPPPPRIIQAPVRPLFGWRTDRSLCRRRLHSWELIGQDRVGSGSNRRSALITPTADFGMSFMALSKG